MALPEIPDATEMARQVDEALLPAFLLGMVTITGPIDDQDRERARRILEVTETREALASFLRGGKVRSDVRRVVALDQPNVTGARHILDARARQDVLRQVDQLEVTSGPEDVSNELWEYVRTNRRAFAESILRGIIPE